MAGKAPYYLLPKQPFITKQRTLADPYLKALHTSLQSFHLKHASRVEFCFDPFHESVQSIRDLMYHTSAKRIRVSNPKCTVKTTIATDRSEPEIRVKLENGSELVYRSAQLTTLEIVDHLKRTLNKFDVPPEESLA